MKKLFPLVLALALLVSFLACAPRTAPPPSSSPSTPVPAAPRVAPTPVISHEEAALQKLVDAAKKEGSVTLYSFNFVGDVGIAMQKAFKERYGIKVDIITGRGAEFLERLKTEARSGNRTGDWTEGSMVHLINMKKAGLTAPLTNLPVLLEKDVWELDVSLLDPDGHLLAHTPAFLWPFLSTRLVKPEEEPKSWFDLLQPKWKGKILFTDPMVSSNLYLIFQPLFRAGVLKEDYLEKLGAQDLLFVTGPPQAIEWLSRGQAPIFAAAQASDGSNAAREGAPIKVFDLKEGIPAQLVLQAAIKDAPHPNAAKLFTNWFLSKEGQSVYTKMRGSASVRKDVPSGLPPALSLEPAKPIYPTSDDLEIQGKMFRDKTWVSILKKK